MAVPKKGEGWGLVGCSKGRGQGRVGLAVGGGKGSGGGARASGPRDGANFATCVFVVSNAYKKKKNGFF